MCRSEADAQALWQRKLHYFRMHPSQQLSIQRKRAEAVRGLESSTGQPPRTTRCNKASVIIVSRGRIMGTGATDKELLGGYHTNSSTKQHVGAEHAERSARKEENRRGSARQQQHAGSRQQQQQQQQQPPAAAPPAERARRAVGKDGNRRGGTEEEQQHPCSQLQPQQQQNTPHQVRRKQQGAERAGPPANNDGCGREGRGDKQQQQQQSQQQQPLQKRAAHTVGEENENGTATLNGTDMEAQSSHGGSSNLDLRRLHHNLPDGVRKPTTQATHHKTGAIYVPGAVRGSSDILLRSSSGR